jgi:hypothetical protein
MLRRVAANIGSQVVALGATFLERILVVGVILRAWGPDQFADWSVLQSAAAFCVIGELGLQVYFTNMEKERRACRDISGYRRHVAVSASFYLATIMVVVASAGVFVASVNPNRIFELTKIDGNTASRVLLLLCIGFAFSIGRTFTTCILVACDEFAAMTMFGVATMVSNALSILIIVGLGGGPISVAASFCFINLLSTVIILLETIRRHPTSAVAPALPTREEIRAVMHHGKWLAVLMVGSIVAQYLPVIIMNLLQIGGEELTSYLLLRTIANLLRQGLNMASLGAGVELATLAYSVNLSKAWRLSAEIGVAVSALSAVGVGGMLVFGTPIISLWSGDARYFNGSLAILIFIAVPLIAPLQQPISILRFTNVTIIGGIPSVIQAPLTLLLGVGCGMIGGVLGVAAGVILAEVVANWAVIFRGEVRHLQGFGRYCLDCAFAMIAGGVWSWLVAKSVFNLPVLQDLYTLVLELAAWLVIGVIPVLWMTLPSSLMRQIAKWHRTANGKSTV